MYVCVISKQERCTNSKMKKVEVLSKKKRKKNKTVQLTSNTVSSRVLTGQKPNFNHKSSSVCTVLDCSTMLI